MTKLEIAALYAGLNLLILLFLAMRVPLLRRRFKIGIGDGGNMELMRAIRTHGNAAEYIPAAIGALLFMALLDPVPLWLVHALGALMTIGRGLHAWGLSRNEGVSAPRFLGTVLTHLALLGFAAALIWGAVAAL